MTERQEEISEGDQVTWMGNKWIVQTIDGHSFILESPEDPTIKALAYWGEIET